MVDTDIEIVFINSNDLLLSLAENLQTKNEFAFDTEFDRFWREYGFKLLLIQIYDGDKCYLIDPLAIQNLQPLWSIFEDNNICKIAYACSEDIQLLKIHGCHTKNLFDVQVAAKLCNHSGNSFGDLVLDLCHTTIDKSLQRSNWRTRPLPIAQQIYASNDVIWLPQLKAHFHELAKERGVHEMLTIENEDCEKVVVTAYEVKLSSKQQAHYSSYHKASLLKLLLLRNEIAESYNLPPFMICTDATLEEIIENPLKFLEEPFQKGFAAKFRNNENNKAQFLAIVKSIDPAVPTIAARKEKIYATERKITNYPDKEVLETKCKKIHAVVTEKYGIVGGEFILRGLKKSLSAKPYKEITLKSYQFDIIDKTCAALGIEL